MNREMASPKKRHLKQGAGGCGYIESQGKQNNANAKKEENS
jgi:hypothetical protein